MPANQLKSSVIWKPDWAGSNCTVTMIDRAKVASVVAMAIQRAPSLARSALFPLSSLSRTMHATPSIGVKVVRERMPGIRSAPPVDGDAEDDRHAEQHHEGVVIDIAGLDAPHALAGQIGDEGDAVRPQAVDQLLVPALPEQVAEQLRASYEDEVVELVEVP